MNQDRRQLLVAALILDSVLNFPASVSAALITVEAKSGVLGTNFLYEAYVGRTTASSSNTVSVFVNDNAIAVGTTNTLADDINRTWYDGVSCAAVTPPQFSVTDVAYNADTKSVTFS